VLIFHAICLSSCLRIHSIWQQLYNVGFGDLEAAELAKAEAVGIAASRKLDDQMLREFHWHAASGKRLRLSRECFSNEHVRQNMIWYYLILDPTSWGKISDRLSNQF